MCFWYAWKFTVKYYLIILLIPLELRDQDDNSKDGLSAGIIGGAIAGAVVFIVIILLCIGVWCVKRSKQKKLSFAPNDDVHTIPG